MWAGWSHERLCEEPSGAAGAPGLSAMMDVFTATLTGVAATSWPPVAPENFKYGKCNRRSMFSALINFNEKSATCSQWLPHWQAQAQTLQNPFSELYREEGPNSVPNQTHECLCTRMRGCAQHPKHHPGARAVLPARRSVVMGATAHLPPLGSSSL